jgi:hypothetical protein
MFSILSTGIFSQEAKQVWKKAIREYYKPSLNVLEVDYLSTERGVYDNVNGGYIDSLKVTKESNKMVFDNSKGFISFSNKIYSSYSYLDTNTTIHYYRKYIAINPIEKDKETSFGDYMNYSMIVSEFDYFRFMIQPKYYKDTTPNFFNTFKDKDYYVFQWIDSTLNVNNILMIEKVSAYVNTQTYNIDKITTERENNTLAEVGLGAIYREIKFKRNLEEEKRGKIEDYMIDVNSDLRKDYMVVRNNFPWAIETQEKINQDKIKDSIINEWKSRPNILDNEDLNRAYTDFEGKNHYLKDEKGWIMLDNWFSTCFPCFEFMKMVYDNYPEFEKRGIKVLSINLVEKPNPRLKSYCENQKIKMDNVLFSQKNNKLFTIYSPTIVLINPEKQIIRKEYDLPHDMESFLKILDEITVKK